MQIPKPTRWCTKPSLHHFATPTNQKQKPLIDFQMQASPPPPPPPPPSPATFSSLPNDVLVDRILTLLDRPSLGSLCCVSRHLHSLVVTSTAVWSQICAATWPSTLSPILRHVIPSFPSDNPYLSFFLQSYPVVASTLESCDGPCPNRLRKLISAVDVRYLGDLVFSRAVETDTSSGRFARSPFVINLLEPEEVVPTPLRELPDANSTDELTLSWIMVDPEGKRAANLSSLDVLDICRYFTREVHGRFFCVLGGEEGTARELVQFEIIVVLGEDRDGRVEVRKLSLWARDLEMKQLNGENSLGILERGALGTTERRWKERSSVAARRRDEFRHRSSMRQEEMGAPERFLPEYFRIPRQ